MRDMFVGGLGLCEFDIRGRSRQEVYLMYFRISFFDKTPGSYLVKMSPQQPEGLYERPTTIFGITATVTYIYFFIQFRDVDPPSITYIFLGITAILSATRTLAVIIFRASSFYNPNARAWWAYILFGILTTAFQMCNTVIAQVWYDERRTGNLGNLAGICSIWPPTAVGFFILEFLVLMFTAVVIPGTREMTVRPHLR